MNDQDLQALLRPSLPALPDEGFTAAVMQRVRTLPPSPAPALGTGLGPAQALATLLQRQARAHRDGRCTRYGLAAGLATAVAMLTAAGGVPMDPATPSAALGLALATSGAAVAWALLNEPA